MKEKLWSIPLLLVDTVELLRAAGELLRCSVFSLVVLGPNSFLRNRNMVVYSVSCVISGLLHSILLFFFAFSFHFSVALQTTVLNGCCWLIRERERENAFIHEVPTGWQPKVSSPSLSLAKGRHKANNNDGKCVITDRNVNNLLHESKRRKKEKTDNNSVIPFLFVPFA